MGDEVGSKGERVAVLAGALLALFATAEAVGLAALYDFRFGFTSLGVVAAGVGAGGAAAPWLRRRAGGAGAGLTLALASLTVVVTVVAHLLLPSGPGALPLPSLFLPALPAIGVGAALAILLMETGRPSPWHLPLSLFVGLIAAAVVTRYAGGPLVASAVAGGGLALLALGVAAAGWGRRLAQGALLLLVLTVLASGYRLSPRARWVEGHGAKPFYRDLATGVARRLATHWQGLSRLDLARARWSGDHLLWPAVDGHYLLPAAGPGRDGETRWLRGHFPLLTLALEATRPARLLVVSAGGGLPVRLAREAGVGAIDVVESSRLARRAITAGGRHRGLAHESGVTLSRATLLAHLVRQTEPYDAILLALPAEEGEWRGRDPAAGGGCTREALVASWRHLAPGGSLIVVTGDGALYGRTLLSAWAAWAEVAGRELPLSNHAAGVRRLSLSARVPLLQYLAIIQRDGDATELGGRLERALSVVRGCGLPPDTTLATLFGPGVRAKAPYPALATVDPEAARPALFQALSWRAQVALDLRPATVDRPLFFQVVRDLPGSLKAVLLIALAVLAALLLLPLAAERRVDHPAAATLPPLPLLLAACGLGAALPAAGVGALCLLAALATGGLAVPLVASAAGGVAGVVVAGKVPRTGGWGVWGGAALLFNLAMVGAGWLLGAKLLALPLAAAAGGLAIVAAVAAYLAARQLHAGGAAIADCLPGLGRWSPAVAGAALLVAAVAMPWTVQRQGIATVWLAAAGGHAVVFATALWLRRLRWRWEGATSPMAP